MADLLRTAVIGMGILLLMIDFLTYVYEKITEGVALLWLMFGAALILAGAVPGLREWTSVVPKKAVPALLFLGVLFLLAAFYVSSLVSQLLRKNQELAMHVSLLNQENECILNELEQLKGLHNYEDTVCH